MTTLIPTRPSRLSSWLRPDPFLSLREEFDDMLSRFAGDGGWLTGEAAPAMDVAETESQFEISMELPGVKPDEVDIEITGRVVRVSGEHTEEREEKGKTFHRTERRFGAFSRSVTLPCGLDENNVEAVFSEGVLKVTLPKAEEAKSRHIEIRS